MDASLEGPAVDVGTSQAAFPPHLGEITPRRKKSHRGSLRAVLLARHRSESTGNQGSETAASGFPLDGPPLPASDAHSGQHVQTGEGLLGLQFGSCSLCGSDEPAAWFDLDSLLKEVQDPVDEVFSGHESDESGCSASSRVSQQQAQADSLCVHRAATATEWCFPSAAGACDLPDASLPAPDASDFSEEDLLMCLDVACQELGVTGGHCAEDDASRCSAHAALSTAACAPAGAQLAAPLLRTSSSNSSAGTLSSAGCNGGAQRGTSGGLADKRTQQVKAPHGPAACGSGQRKRGRPRRYDTTLPLLPGAMDAQAMAAMAGHINGVDSEKRKRTRGAKPKYQYLTAEEAIAHRRERNRITALASYEKRKARENALRSQIAELEREQAALRQLAEFVQQPVADKCMIRELLVRPDASICAVANFVRSTAGSAAAGVAV